MHSTEKYLLLRLLSHKPTSALDTTRIPSFVTAISWYALRHNLAAANVSVRVDVEDVVSRFKNKFKTALMVDDHIHSAASVTRASIGLRYCPV